MKRRDFVVGVGAACLVRRSRASALGRLAEIEADLGGRLGVAALDTDSGARLAHRGDERFALCSTFKWLLATAVLAKADRGAAGLDQRLSYAAADLLDGSPATRDHLAERSLSLRSLCEAAVQVSDNTAANVLLKFLGGPQSLTEYLRRSGDPVTRLDRFEPELNSNLPKDPRDTTTANAMIANMQRILLGPVLSDGSRDLLLTWLRNCRTGAHRLRAGLPHAWTVGDKTGSGANGAVNDIAIAWPPRRRPLLIAVYMSGSHASMEALAAAHARIAGIAAAQFS